jgi:hypothetical protein
MTVTLRTPGRLTVGTTVYAVNEAQIMPDVQAQQVVHSGFGQAQQVIVPGSGVPMIRATGPLSRLLTGLGLVTTAPSAAALTIATVDGAVIPSGSVHTRYDLAASAKVCAYIDSFQVDEGGEALADVVLRFYSANGSADPIAIQNNVAFPALTAAALHHGVGPLVVNGVGIEGVVGINYASGYQFSAVRSDSLPYPIGETQGGGRPSITVQVVAPKEAWDAITAKGTAISSTTTVQLNAYTPGSGVLTATDARIFTVASGFVHCEQWGASHGEMVRGSIRILPASADGSASGFVVT